MRKTTVLVSALLTTVISLDAQEISLAEALDTEGIEWQSVAGPLGEQNPNDPLVLSDENKWHGVSDVSYDGEDAIHVKMPQEKSAYTSLTAVIQGPVRISFWYKILQDSQNQLHYFASEPEFEPVYPYPWATIRNKTWTQVTETILNPGTFKLNINVNGIVSSGPWEAWIDRFEIETSFPPTITEFPEFFPVPLGKGAKLSVEADVSGEATYTWYKDDVEVPGETGSSIQLPVSEEPAVVSYKVKVTDALGETTSDVSTIEYFSLSDALDTETINFTFDSLSSQNYSHLLVKASEAYDGEDALRLEYGCRRCSALDYKAPSMIAAALLGPTIISFYYQGHIRVTVNDESVDARRNISEGDWKKAFVPVENGGAQIIRWSTGNFFPYVSSYGITDQISLSQTPIITRVPDTFTTVVGQNKELDYSFVSLGDTTHQLLKSGEVVAQTTNQNLSLEGLGLDASGYYQIRIANEYGEESVSAQSTYIQIIDTIGEAVEQPDLIWTYEGEEIWIPQIFETYDGDDAAMQLDEGDGSGFVSTLVAGPALVSFWWKDGSWFSVNEGDLSLNYGGSGWQQVEFVLTKETNTLMWQDGFFDRLQIEYVDPIGEAVEQPDLEWTLTGNRIWIPQTEESYDGEDAAYLLNDGSGQGTVSTTVSGPAIISFWWKDGDTFANGAQIINYTGEGWQQVQTVIQGESSILSWNAGYFDQLEIQDISGDPFMQWAFTEFDSGEVINDLEGVAKGDRDYDGLSNLLEWAFNKNVDFPNQSIGYTIVESEGNRYLGMLFSRPAELGDFVISLDASTDLTNWQRIESIVSETYNQVNNTYTVSIHDIQPLDTEGRFIRLRLTDED